MGHLEEVNETWFTHFKFAIGIAALLLVAAVALVIHAFIPNILTHYASDAIQEIDEILEARLH